MWEKIVSLFTGKTLDGVSNILDEVITNEPERLEAKARLNKSISDGLNRAMSYQRDVLVQELKGNWLQRSWRPIMMLAFGFIVVFKYFIWQLVMAFNPSVEDFDLIPNFWSLLEIGIGGYVIGRSVEKTAETVTQNMDLRLLKKKDRADKYQTDDDNS